MRMDVVRQALYGSIIIIIIIIIIIVIIITAG